MQCGSAPSALDFLHSGSPLPPRRVKRGIWSPGLEGTWGGTLQELDPHNLVVFHLFIFLV